MQYVRILVKRIQKYILSTECEAITVLQLCQRHLFSGGLRCCVCGVCLGHLVEVFEEVQLPRKSNFLLFYFFLNEYFQNSIDLYFKLSIDTLFASTSNVMKMLYAQYNNVMAI